MSRDYPPLTRKKQKRKDGREWVVAKYSYIYAIVIFAVALLCLIDVEAGFCPDCPDYQLLHRHSGH